MASRIAAEKEVSNLRLEISRLAKNQSEATRQLAVLHVQNSQVSSERRRLGAYGGLILNLIVVCCVFVLLLFAGWNRTF
ncbi:hypothetical protein DOTSEDRAFT_42474 [Dothistroma septosporum NZE10]|uniref:Uncharacterized protein n=1 Tax=Dothistroma septosporum (strain NZE10 / CBS 128990) TaxID=675120 RepID=N1PZ10_DOTSN|nr:hypothetical protein DOTSEDRAFT_42474 [Dothistroma septosporum NZE10]